MIVVGLKKKQFLWVRSCGLFAKGLGYDFQLNST